MRIPFFRIVYTVLLLLITKPFYGANAEFIEGRRPEQLELRSFVSPKTTSYFGNYFEKNKPRIDREEKRRDQFITHEIEQGENSVLERNLHFVKAFLICEALAVKPYNRSKPFGFYLEKAMVEVEQAILIEQNVACLFYLKGLLKFNLAEPESWFYLEKCKYPGLTEKDLKRNCFALRQEALLCFQKALQIDPKCSISLLAIAGVHEFLNQNETALEFYNRFIYQEPLWARAYISRANVLSALGRETDAKRSEAYFLFLIQLKRWGVAASLWNQNLMGVGSVAPFFAFKNCQEIFKGKASRLPIGLTRKSVDLDLGEFVKIPIRSPLFYLNRE